MKAKLKARERPLHWWTSDPGWKPDPEVFPIRWRWWDGERWTGKTHRESGLYGVVIPVRNKWHRAGNVLISVLTYFAVWTLATRVVDPIWFDPRDPHSVYIQDLDRDVEPWSLIPERCPSVVRVDRNDGFRGSSDEQRYGVEAKPGHVDRALLNVKTGEVTCP